VIACPVEISIDPANRHRSLPPPDLVISLARLIC
jgi:hypothetical protein